MLRLLLYAAAVAIGCAALAVVVLAMGWLGNPEPRGKVTDRARPADQVAARVASNRAAAMRQGVAAPKQILFGDFHVHTTFSFDAFMQSLPVAGGEGARPPADACDFARFCSALDFWSVNDHAEGLTARQWRETVQSIRECNAAAGATQAPDTVAFLGWEWSQIDYLPETHYGHKNVVLRHTDDARIPARPIGSQSEFTRGAIGGPPLLGRVGLGLLGGQRGRDFVHLMLESADMERCAPDVPVRELPADCRELVETPAELFGKLDEWGHASIVIPHGNAWGLYTPPGASWDKQLAGHDPQRETMMEIYSGHGSSEEYRDFRAVELAPDGSRRCPAPSPDYEPQCWRAGEIIAERCRAAGESQEECGRRAAAARRHSVDALLAGHRAVPGAESADWLDAGQCRDCFQPAYNLRPGNSAQYMLALRRFDAEGDPLRFRMAFMGSSDNHTSRAGSGYKEIGRGRMTDARGFQAGAEGARLLLPPASREELPESIPFDPRTSEQRGLALFDFERMGSYMVSGGLVATHAAGRDRDAIWEALERREVYATSGPRILLWFDLLNRDLPMGSSTRLSENPHFRVRAIGSRQQAPGCPEDVEAALGSERMQALCLGECHNPSDERKRITRIEVIRVRPQSRPDEPIGELVEDPWRVFPCASDAGGCSVIFEDPDFATAARDAVYYVRAIEEPSLAISAGGVRCERDSQGRCTEVNLCGRLAPFDDDCLAETEPRAWSSPIFVDYERVTASGP
jgi:hypothetical protein